MLTCTNHFIQRLNTRINKLVLKGKKMLDMIEIMYLSTIFFILYDVINEVVQYYINVVG